MNFQKSVLVIILSLTITQLSPQLGFAQATHLINTDNDNSNIVTASPDQQTADSVSDDIGDLYFTLNNWANTTDLIEAPVITKRALCFNMPVLQYFRPRSVRMTQDIYNYFDQLFRILDRPSMENRLVTLRHAEMQELDVRRLEKLVDHWFNTTENIGYMRNTCVRGVLYENKTVIKPSYGSILVRIEYTPEEATKYDELYGLAALDEEALKKIVAAKKETILEYKSQLDEILKTYYAFTNISISDKLAIYLNLSVDAMFIEDRIPLNATADAAISAWQPIVKEMAYSGVEMRLHGRNIKNWIGFQQLRYLRNRLTAEQGIGISSVAMAHWINPRGIQPLENTMTFELAPDEWLDYMPVHSGLNNSCY